LEGGCNEEVNLRKNTLDLRDVELIPDYLSKHTKSEGDQESFNIIEMGNSKIVFQGNSGYVGASNGENPMTCKKKSFGDWEVFTWSAVIKKLKKLSKNFHVFK